MQHNRSFIINFRHLDWKLIAVALLLTLIGVVLIYSAHHYSASEFKQGYYLRQLVWLCVSLTVVSVLVNVPLRAFDAGAYLFYGVAIVLLALVFVIGSTRLGATRWFVLGPLSVSPSDIAKLALLLALARFFAYARGDALAPKKFVLSAFMVMAPVVLILKQPDLGTSLVFVALLIGIWFWSGLSLAYLGLIVSPALSLVASADTLAWALYFVALLALIFFTRPGIVFGSGVVLVNLICGIITPFVWNGLQNYQKMRILTFLDPGQDPLGAGYQIIQSRISIGSGGLTGKGFLGSTQSRLEFLPERHTDFIFSVLGEEFGLLGALVVLGLFFYLLFRLIKIALRCRSRFAGFVVFGAATIIAFQMFVNIGMTIGVTPVTGLPLPFLSYGGTSLVFNWTLIALALIADYSWQEY
ncbi:rod shape-determining protein RodA [Gemmatimonas aurantiaca]|nr:rod shape-determining protein RodA [Gemmatimonas aurantiaca]